MGHAPPLKPIVFAAAFALVLAAPAVRAQRFESSTFTLANGLQVVVIPNHRAPLVSQMIWYKAGGADDPRGHSGVAHFLEHLMYRGTKSLPAGAFNRIVAANGGRDNAFTTHDYTAFFQDVASDRLETVMKLEADRMTNLALTDANVLPERQVIIEERHSRVDNAPASLFREALDAALYIHLPYHTPVIGWLNEMSALSTSDARAFYRAWYAPNNAVLVISGDVTVPQVRALAEKYYGPAPRRAVPPHLRLVEPPHVASQTLTMKSPRVADPVWMRAWLAPSYTAGDTKQAYALQVLAEVLGGGPTSLLYRRLVVEQKLALNAMAFYDPATRDLSSFNFYAVLAKNVTVADFQAALDAVVRDAVAHRLSAAEVERAKSRMCAESVFAQDSLDGLAREVGAAIADGRSLEDVEAWPDRIGAVTAEQVDAALKSIVKDDVAVTGVLLPGATS